MICPSISGSARRIAEPSPISGTSSLRRFGRTSRSRSIFQTIRRATSLAVVSGSTDIDKISDDCPSATITFKIVDPDYYGRKRRVEFTGETALSSGGNIDAHFKATVKGASGDRFRLTNLDTAEFVEVVGKLTGDSVIRIDTGLERATVNNRTAQVSIDSDFFKLGQRSRIRASSGSVLIEWSERWL